MIESGARPLALVTGASRGIGAAVAELTRLLLPALRTARGSASGMPTITAAALIEDRAESRNVTA